MADHMKFKWKNEARALGEISVDMSESKCLFYFILAFLISDCVFVGVQWPLSAHALHTELCLWSRFSFALLFISRRNYCVAESRNWHIFTWFSPPSDTMEIYDSDGIRRSYEWMGILVITIRHSSSTFTFDNSEKKGNLHSQECHWHSSNVTQSLSPSVDVSLCTALRKLTLCARMYK